MAEFALGLTKTVVEGTVIRVKSAIDEEANLKVRVQNDLVFITGEFEMMQSFLNVANKERAKNEVVRTWVRQIRNLAFDVEDCVELVVNLDIKSGWSWLWRVVPSCMAPPRPIDDAVAEIQRLKAMVEDVSHRNTRYNLIGDTGSSSNSGVTTVSSLLKATGTVSAFHTLREVWEAAGKKGSGTGNLKKLIISEGSDVQVISLWGSPGVVDLRMPHILREVYNDPEICQKFKSRAWIKLMHPFNPNEFLKILWTQFYASSHSQENVTGGVEFRKKMKGAVAMEDEIMQQLCDQRYLVIVEQLSTVVDWDVIRIYLPDTSKGSRIIVSTQNLGLALSCVGKPYQVSELKHFSQDQSLCAFIKKVPGHFYDMSDFFRELKHGGVISVWEEKSSSVASTTHLDSKSATFLYRVYTSITHMSKGFIVDGVKFEEHGWVDIPRPFNLDVFSRRLLLSFYSDDFGAKEIAAVGRMGEGGAIQHSNRVLREHNCLIIINGVENADDWDLIKTTFLSEPTKGCILVITNPTLSDTSVRVDHQKDCASLARHCVDQKDRAINIKNLEADIVLRNFIQSSQYYGIGGKKASRRGRLFFNRIEEARIWTKQFGHVVHNDKVDDLVYHLTQPGVFSVLGTTGAGKVPLVRKTYYDQILISRQDDNMTKENYHEIIRCMQFTKFSWVDVPHPFNLADFSWRLLLDFHSDDLEAKEVAAVNMINDQDPVKGCRTFMHQARCLVVINGLCSTHDWDLIRESILSSAHSTSCIVIITNEASVATHCADGEHQVLNIKGVEAEVALRPLTKDCGYYGNECDEASHFFSTRREEAIYWAKTFEPVGRQIEAACEIARHSNAINYSLSSVWGIAGVGKSAIIRRVYCHRMLGLSAYVIGDTSSWVKLEGKFTKFSWVDVPHPFNLLDFCWRLLVDFHSDDLEAKETIAVGMIDGVHDLVAECRKFVHTECFIVIDGLCSTRDWDLIRDALLLETTKGYIVVITNEEKVARYCVPHEYRQVVNVKGLEPEAALHLFNKVTFGGQQWSHEDTEVTKLTLAKCGGLSKVIAAIGEQNRGPELIWLKYLNNDFMDRLQTDSRFHNLRGLFSWMQSYFDACSDALKPCIFYLSVFPADYNVRRRRLLWRWVAEGYSRDRFGISADKDGEELFSELVKLSIIQEPTHNLYSMIRQRESIMADVFQVNGFFHGYIMSRPIEDNLVFALEGCCSPNLKHAGQHLTIRSSWDRDEIVFKSMDLSRLRSLTVFGEWRSFFISKYVSMGLLRVLDLEDTSGLTDGSLEQIGKLLPRLKFLSIRGCKDITRVPNSLGGLRQLQILDVRHTCIVELPSCIIKLHRLQYIRAGNTDEPLDQGPDTQPLAPADHDGTSTNQPAMAAAQSDGTNTSQPAIAAAHCDDTSTSRPSIAAAHGDGASTSQPAVAAAPLNAHGASTSQPTTIAPADGHGGSTSQPTATPETDGDDQDQASTTLAPWKNRAHDLINWLCKEKKLRRRQRLDDDNGGGVKVPAEGIGNMTALHTFGVVNVSSAGGKAILKELKKLTQLRKLGLSGINRENWSDLCCAVSGHAFLESLSLHLDKEEPAAANFFSCSDDMLSDLPKSLKSLKLYAGDGKVQVSPASIKPFGNLKKVHLELTMSTQEDIDSLMGLKCQNMYHHLSIKPIQDGELRYGRWENNWRGEGFNAAKLLKIDCGSYSLKILFGRWIPEYVEVLAVHCSTTEASLEVSGLNELDVLKEVWLKGSYNEAVKQHLQQKLDELHSQRVQSTAYGWKYPCLRVPLLEEQARPS